MAQLIYKQQSEYCVNRPPNLSKAFSCVTQLYQILANIFSGVYFMFQSNCISTPRAYRNKYRSKTCSLVLLSPNIYILW